MKKIRILPIILAVFMLSGCVSDAQYNELASRVKSLEKEVAELRTLYVDQQEVLVDATENTLGVDAGNSSDVESDSLTAGVEDILTNDIEQESKKLKYSYYIDSLPVEAVVNECVYYFNAIPNVGDTYEQHYNKLKAVPITSEYSKDRPLYYSFVDELSYYKEPEKDIIMSISYEGIQTEMDGTIGYVDKSWDPYLSVNVEMKVYGYERAVEIYDGLYNYLSSFYEDVYGNRNSTYWYAQGELNKGNSGYGFYFLTMQKSSNDSFCINTKFLKSK